VRLPARGTVCRGEQPFERSTAPGAADGLRADAPARQRPPVVPIIPDGRGRQSP